MKPFGLTGNIGCGKSTVAALLSTYPDVMVFDCDKIAKALMASETHRHAINAILEREGELSETADFRDIARIVFEQPEKKKLLEKLIHPLVWEVVQTKVDAAHPSTLCVAESALIFETDSEERFAGVIVATCNLQEQLRRLQENRQMDARDIQARLRAQLPSNEKEERADFVIATDCTLEELKSRVDRLYHALKETKGDQS